MAEKFTNIIGVPVKDYVKKQLYIRANNGSTVESRNENQILYLANKNCWIKLSSFVDVTNPGLLKSYQLIDFNNNSNNNFSGKRNDLAKQWILFGGTSYYNNNATNLRSSIELSENVSITNKSAYGLGGLEYGYKPMPGITSATIQHAGAAGSLRYADIKIKAWNRNQLDILDTLYFRLGYSCLIEWGHTSYLDNNGNLVSLINPLDIFDDQNKELKTKEGVLRGINQKKKETKGNYDGMLGTISNYEWSQSPDGGYDCTVKLVGYGSIIDSLKINQPYGIPGSERAFVTTSTNNNYTQGAPVVPPPTAQAPKENQVINPNIIFFSETGETLKTGDRTYIDFEKLKERYNKLKELEKKDDTYKYSIGIDFAYKQGNEQIPYIDYDIKFSKDYLSSSKIYLNTTPVIKDGTTFNLINENVKFKGIGPEFLNTLNDNIKDALKFINNAKSAFNIQITNNTKVTLTENFELKNKITFDNVPVRAIKKNDEWEYDYKQFIADSVDIQIYFFIDSSNNEKSKEYKKNIPILRPTFSDPIKKVRGPLNDIKSPILRRVFADYLSAPYGNDELESILKVETVIKGKKIITEINNIFSFLQPTNDNELIIKLKINTEHPNDTPAGDIIQVVKDLIDKVKNNIETSKNQTGNGTFKDPVIVVSSLDNSQLVAKNFQSKSTTSFIYNIAKYTYNYSAQNISNNANNEGTVEQAIETPASSLPLNYFSNIDKFLIDLRDEASKSPGEGEVNLKTFIENQLKDGALEKIRTKNITDPVPTTPDQLSKLSEESQFFYFIKKGLNSEYISGETDKININDIPDVNYDDLFKVYKSGLTDYQSQGETSKFYYIKLGLLLYYINNNSLLYERKENEPAIEGQKSGTRLKKPLIYIDYNPKTNFCLTTGYHFSIDPGVCITKLELVDDDFKKLFSEATIPQGLFTGASDAYSPNVNSGFKNDVKDLRGNIMDLCINIDYIINIVQKQSDNNNKSDVYLRSFLETIMEDINKSLGNINSFRVGYYDEANTVRIYDEQYINPPSNQSTIDGSGLYELMSSEGLAIPLLGKNSIARNFTLKTDVSTKLSQQIAISSNAAGGPLGALNTDGSGIGSISANLVDRLIPIKEESLNNKNNEVTDGDKGAAKIFSDHVRSVYVEGIYIKDQVSTARNYYCTAANKFKAEALPTKNRLVLPLGIEIGMDGISGLSLLEGFTLPVDILPNQYLDEQRKSRVGFVIAGLNHTISDNQWTTSIRGQMIATPVPSNLYSNQFGVIATAVGGGKKKDANFVSVGANPKPLGKDQKSAYDEAERLEPGFKAKVAQVAESIGATELSLAKIMYFESAGTYNPAITNFIGCVGLTQFCPDKKRGSYKTIGGTRYELANLAAMTRIEQLDVVQKYFKALKFSSSKPVGMAELYLVNLYPVALNKSNDFILGSENSDPNRKFLVASQNPGFPTSITIDGRKVLTRGDVVRFVNTL